MFEELSKPFSPDKVSWRVGKVTKDGKKAMALAYLDARDVMHRLDEVCGPANWQCDYPHADVKTVCRIGIKIDGEWVWKSNGAGNSDIEAEKGALSDAFKRAAVMWGIGRYLYDVQSPWVEINEYKQIKESEYPKLHKILPASIHSPTKELSPEPDSEDIKNNTKADKVVIRALEVLEPLDGFDRGNMLMENLEMAKSLKWVKSKYPEKFEVIRALGVNV